MLLASGLTPLPAVADVPPVSLAGVITGTGPSAPLLLFGQSTCAVALKGTATGITIVPQATSDAAPDVQNGSAVWTTVGSINGGSITYAGSQANYTGNVAATGITAFRINVTAYTSGTPAYTLTCSPALAGVNNPLPVTQSGTWNVATTGQIATYAIAPTSLAPQAGDVLLMQGSASKTIRIRKILISGSSTTTASSTTFTLVRRSSGNTGGTTASPTIVARDTSSAAATATVTTYSTAPTQGTVVGALDRQVVLLPTAGSLGESLRWEYGTLNDQPVTLRGTSDYVAIVTSATNINIIITMVWTEE